MPIPILIDTDAGEDIDDILCIAFALLRPELDVKAVTTVTHGTKRRAQLVKQLLRSVGQGETPVAAGMELPMRPLNSQERVQITNSAYVLNHALSLDDEGYPNVVSMDAVSLIIQTVEQHPGELGIVCIGPLTNIACALHRAPEIAGKIRWISAMGGEVDIFRIEHNIWWDYIAADVVLNAKVPLFLGTWNVTRRFALTPEDCDAIHSYDSPLCRMLSKCIKLWWPHKGAKTGPVMYDIAPMIWAMGIGLYATEPMEIKVETKGELTSGMTLRFWGEPNANVTVDMKPGEVKKLYLDTILER